MAKCGDRFFLDKEAVYYGVKSCLSNFVMSRPFFFPLAMHDAVNVWEHVASLIDTMNLSAHRKRRGRFLAAAFDSLMDTLPPPHLTLGIMGG